MKKYVSMVIFLLAWGCVPEFNPLPQGKRFIITQSLVYQNEVDLTSHGIVFNQIIYTSSLVSPTDKNKPLSEPELQVWAHTLKEGIIPTVIDPGLWSIYTIDTLMRKENLQKLIFVIESLRKARPDIQFGFYGVVPQRDDEPLVDLKLFEWQSFNDSALVDFVPHVDAIFPKLYTYHEDPKGWEVSAIQTLKEAKRFNKPVYAFIWPKFHKSNQALNGSYLPVEYWRLELETCFRYCDGIVIWNYEPTINWDPGAGWWKETLAFIDELKISID
jgi:hypothetical protein